MIRDCPCPVWITRPHDGQPGVERIVAATNFSPVSDRAVKLAARLAAFDDAQLHVVHALDFSPVRYFTAAGLEQATIETYREQKQSDARDLMDRTLAFDEVARLRDVETTLREGPADQVILDVLQETKAQLLVLGTASHSAEYGFFMGTTAERVLPRVECSLVSVKPVGFESPVT